MKVLNLILNAKTLIKVSTVLLLHKILISSNIDKNKFDQNKQKITSKLL